MAADPEHRCKKPSFSFRQDDTKTKNLSTFFVSLATKDPLAASPY
jgi:hypothetical protein